MPSSTKPAPVPLDRINNTVIRAQARALSLSKRLEALVEPILLAYGEKAARRFQALAHDHLAAAGSPEKILAAKDKVEQRKADLSRALRRQDQDEIRAAKARLRDARDRLFDLSGQTPRADWTAPANADDLVDAKGLAQSLHGKTDPVRLALVETTVKTTLEGTGVVWDISNPLIGRAMSEAGLQITHISESTRANVMAIIRESYDQGLSIRDTSLAIKAGMREAASTRATLIARTEMTRAVNAGSMAAVQIVDNATGQGHSKVWKTAPGAKYPRHEDYEDLDGQTRAMDAYFQVGGSELQYPGDANGPPEETCNCRCVVIYADGESAGGGEG